MKKATAIIPARYRSSRFPGKSLAPILGRPMLQWVFEGVRQAEFVQRIIIATDDERIFQAAEEFGAEAMMTSSVHNSGTERVAEVAESLDSPIIINVQGDEPLLTGDMVDRMIEALQDESLPMTSLMAKVTDVRLMQNPHLVKVVMNKNRDALYFSRSPLPYQATDHFFLHVGIYGFQRDFLLALAEIPPSKLEMEEKLEQLRVLENGYRIRMIEISTPTLSVDTPPDIIKVEELLRKRKIG